MIDVRTWGNILTLGSIEMFFFYAASVTKTNLNRRRFMCCILAVHFFFCTAIYSFVTWVFINFNIAWVDAIHEAMFLTYGIASVTTAVLLLVVSALPEGFLDELAIMVRADFYFGVINERTGLNIFSVNQAARK